MKFKRKLSIVLILIALVAIACSFGACSFFASSNINLDFDSEIVFEKSLYAYTGEEIKPEITLIHREQTVDAENYDIAYSDNVNPGKAKVSAIGKGKYYGSVQATFDIAYVYSFNVNGGQVVSGALNQAVMSKESIIPPTVEKSGYDFSHWSLNSQSVDFSDIDNLPSSAEFVANYTLKTYTVTYHLNGGENHNLNKNTYTVEDIFALQDATLRGMKFAGWYTEQECKNRISSLEGYSENLNLYAKFMDYNARTIEYRVPQGAMSIPKDTLYPETVLNAPQQQIKEIDGNLKKLVWYADNKYTLRYFFREMPDEDIVVYAQWEDVLKAGFLDKIDEFSSDEISIDSFEELIAYIDYVCFHNITSRIDKGIPIDVDFVKISYVNERNAVKAEIDKALTALTYPRMASISYAYQDGEFKIALVKDLTENEASVSLTDEEDFVVQLGNIFALQSQGRSSGYDKFPIDFVENTYEVTTSNQLFYVLSHGYRPLPRTGSKAESIYNQFRDIMRKICDDTMSDLEKVRAIYEWIILNVQYDNATAYPDITTELGQFVANSENSHLFDAFYLEGVLRGSAVCDGMSKAYSVMCAIEGIDCVRVTGEDIINGGAGHAWNKVKIGGKWYLSDPTWGNSSMGSDNNKREFIAYQYFLFTDEVRSSVHGYGKQNYTYYVADSEFDYQGYYSSRKMEIENYTFDLYIDSDEEFSYLLDYIEINFKGEQLSGFSFEIMINQKALIENQESDGITKSTVENLYRQARNLLRERKGMYYPKIDINSFVAYDAIDENSGCYKRAIYVFK